MELINKLREANAMMQFGAKIDLSHMINEVELYIIAQEETIAGIAQTTKWRNAISQRKSFITFLYVRHLCERRDFIAINGLNTWLKDPTLDNDSVERLCAGIYIYPLRKRNKPNITFEQRKNLETI